MTDFSDMIRDALTGGPAFEPEPGRQALDRAMQRFDRRARTMRWLAVVALLAMTAVLAWGLSQMIRAEEENTRLIAHGTFLAIVGVTGISFTKLWFFIAQNHLMLMREMKGLEFLILRSENAGGEGESGPS